MLSDFDTSVCMLILVLVMVIMHYHSRYHSRYHSAITLVAYPHVLHCIDGACLRTSTHWLTLSAHSHYSPACFCVSIFRQVRVAHSACAFSFVVCWFRMHVDVVTSCRFIFVVWIVVVVVVIIVVVAFVGVVVTRVS